ncbi:MAG: 16S rRNA (adenine(1518)-N(6)/adenine(1519)-N(6))-dimethyltransferase RsmA [Gammaproteobacteria bacterium]|nr:16S rRNA (adenine(1518)-N(6)/adenine(1519)-N(6))-dimethyltransferase RsmA [Gammaproteobacteria bacterium]MCY4200472.1 16S rRNA (adenine(1518)-N(6)/adenine(1519)-N(6))-dimethyltransferase RsmA [Gammaproteobacteria bacterium]MCY4277504.1 16S rRNA (adenine(1518)-N(6)/adenine(1519)-N(6))-dimethyltransferase RsmA [Gammaproteobacteria bacterium]MCY4324007.1 16S rRNA (adenine(1518)-N(6)/adenine(1519)-N(6))-dimethyltransferase RsmA [Gammaproteobacteria bacterium]
MASNLSRGKPRKRFGQHFLRDPFALEEIAEFIAAQPGDALLEIGPGQGALTEHLIATCPTMRAMEIDRDLCRHLRARFPQLDLVEGDVLTHTFEQLLMARADWRLVGNLPYNISTPLLARVCALASHVRDAWFMLQTEVADRLVAEPGTRDWSRLSVMVRLRFRAEIRMTVDASSFHPPPKVTSSLVHLVSKPRDRSIISLPTFEDILKGAFSQRRKTLANALRQFSIDWRQTTVNPHKRPDQIGVDAYIEIANHIASQSIKHPSKHL